jgi:murein DD-endopeptidase MepM/ murein hydrolase activator NlpD
MKLKGRNRLDKLRLIFFSTGETEFRQFEFHLQRVFLCLAGVAIVCVGIFMISVTICNSLYQDNTNDALARTNDFLKQRIKNMQTQMQTLDGKVKGLEDDTEDLEVLVGLTSDDYDSTNVLLSGPQFVMASMPIDYEYNIDKMSDYLSGLEKRITTTVETQDIIEEKFLRTQKEIKHIPSIRPVVKGRVTDKFGKRKDPFLEIVKHHRGVDLSARFGTRVYAAGSGTIEFTRVRYRLNKGYGRVVIINHGYGYKTLYGHLSKINVSPGQLVNRWDIIGESGDTGRATGPHLHYEVWHNGRPKNPEDYMLN